MATAPRLVAAGARGRLELVEDRRPHPREHGPIRRRLGDGRHHEREPVRDRPAELLGLAGPPPLRVDVGDGGVELARGPLDRVAAVRGQARRDGLDDALLPGRLSGLRSGGARSTTISQRIGGASLGRSRHASRAGRRRPRASRSASSGGSGGSSGSSPTTHVALATRRRRTRGRRARAPTPPPPSNASSSRSTASLAQRALERARCTPRCPRRRAPRSRGARRRPHGASP